MKNHEAHPSIKLHYYFTAWICLFISLQTFSQGPAIEWQNTIGGSATDELVTVIESADGGYLLAGSSRSGLSGDKTEAKIGNYDYWIVKINSTGEIVWQNTIGGSGLDYLMSAAATSDGGYILGGYSLSGISGDKTEASSGHTDFWIVKIDESGNIEWQNTIGGSDDDYLKSLIQTSDGGYFLGGTSSSDISGDKTDYSIVSDYWLVKLNADGEIEWQKTIHATSSEELAVVIQTDDDGYLVGGSSYSGISGDKTESNLGENDYWILKLNSSGAIEWQNAYGGNNLDILRSAVQTNDGGYFLGGVSVSGLSGDKSETCFGGEDYWVIKITSEGAIEWQNTIGGNDYEEMGSVIQDADGGYLIAGWSQTLGVSADKTEANTGEIDWWVVKLNSTGTIEWQNTIGGSNDNRLFDAIQPAAGGYLLGGHSDSPVSGDKSEACQGNFDYWVMKLSCSEETCNGIDDNCNGIIDDDPEPPVISISAGGPVTFCKGGFVTLTASHTGVFLQWQKNGVNIAGATSSTYIANNSGDYSCGTTDLCNRSAFSNTITVTVNKKPAASITASGPTTFCEGGSVTLLESVVAGCSYQWLKNGVPIAGETGNSYVATAEGNYKCEVTKIATGCSKSSNVISVSVPCRNEKFTTEEIQIYPNPAFDLITISSNKNLNSIIVTDALGRIMIQYAVTENVAQIDISLWPAGMYLIHTENDSLIFVKQ